MNEKIFDENISVVNFKIFTTIKLISRLQIVGRSRRKTIIKWVNDLYFLNGLLRSVIWCE